MKNLKKKRRKKNEQMIYSRTHQYTKNEAFVSVFSFFLLLRLRSSNGICIIYIYLNIFGVCKVKMYTAKKKKNGNKTEEY